MFKKCNKNVIYKYVKLYNYIKLLALNINTLEGFIGILRPAFL